MPENIVLLRLTLNAGNTNNAADGARNIEEEQVALGNPLPSVLKPPVARALIISLL
ncbi:MAG: hypothetical protein QXU11_08115 [Thermoproteota archaeon]